MTDLAQISDAELLAALRRALSPEPKKVEPQVTLKPWNARVKPADMSGIAILFWDGHYDCVTNKATGEIDTRAVGPMMSVALGEYSVTRIDAGRNYLPAAALDEKPDFFAREIEQGRAIIFPPGTKFKVPPLSSGVCERLEAAAVYDAHNPEVLRDLAELMPKGAQEKRKLETAIQIVENAVGAGKKLPEAGEAMANARGVASARA